MENNLGRHAQMDGWHFGIFLEIMKSRFLVRIYVLILLMVVSYTFFEFFKSNVDFWTILSLIVFVEDCNGSEQQQWSINDFGQIILGSSIGSFLVFASSISSYADFAIKCQDPGTRPTTQIQNNVSRLRMALMCWSIHATLTIRRRSG